MRLICTLASGNGGGKALEASRQCVLKIGFLYALCRQGFAKKKTLADHLTTVRWQVILSRNH
jgi:hypothetical protein